MNWGFNKIFRKVRLGSGWGQTVGPTLYSTATLAIASDSCCLKALLTVVTL